MHETTALKPTMDGVGMGENCPFMRGKRLLYSIDLLGGGAGKWGKNAPTLSYPPSRIPKTKKIELYPSLELYRGKNTLCQVKL